MDRLYKSHKFDKINNTLSYDSSEINSRTPYNKYYNNKTILITENYKDNLNDNLSDISNSVHTSYKYRKRKKGNIIMTSRDSNLYQNCHNQEKENDSNVSISTNDNLICPDCINDTLIEEKKIRENLYKTNNKMNTYQDNTNNYTDRLIEKKRREREKNTNNAMQTLSKLNSSISSKERLIQINENSLNPFQGNNRDYQYEKFKKEYDKRQKMINENIKQYFPDTNKKSISETPLFFDKSDEKKQNPKNKMTKSIKSNYSNNQKEYIKALEEQIKYKKEKQKKEKEEDQKLEQKYFEDMEQKMKKEEEEKLIKEKEKKENFIKENMDIINKKNMEKMKQLSEKMKNKEFLDKQNELYKNELLEKQKENERLLNEIYSSNKKDNDDNNKHKEIKERQRDFNNNNDNNHYNNMKNEDVKKGYNLEDQKGECCRCHRILPRRLLTINRYFYKENRHKNIY